jgi:hypothetical protein
MRGARCSFSSSYSSPLLYRQQKVCDLRGWPKGTAKNTETHEVMFKIWEGLQSKADKDNDGQVHKF